MKKILISITMVSAAACMQAAGTVGCHKAPAWPLITIDPYTSVWSQSDTLNTSNPVHWTGHAMLLTGVIAVDGRPYRFMGVENGGRVEVAPHSEISSWTGCFTDSEPTGEWYAAGYDDSAWQRGDAPFGTSLLPHDTWVPAPGTVVDGDLWLRRSFDMPAVNAGDRVWLDLTYADEADVWLNGHRLEVPVDGALHYQLEVADSLLAAGERNVIAMHTSHRDGNYGTADVGVWVETPAPGRCSEAARQLSAELRPTCTVYRMACGPVELCVEFVAPLLLDDLELLARPVNYINYSYESTDGKAHEVTISVEAGAEWAVNLPGQAVKTSEVKEKGLVLGTIASEAQPVLEKWGDDLRIDWGCFYLGGKARNAGVTTSATSVTYLVDEGKSRSGEGFILVGYDDIYSMEYFGKHLRPYWNRNGDSSIMKQLEMASKEHGRVTERCHAFDSSLLDDALEAGGEAYARLLSMTYRQAIHAHKLLEAPSGRMLYLSKENFSNGSVGTVDLTYPSSPLFLLYNTDLLKGMMNPVFEYCASSEWGKPFAAHDVGRYPKANGQNYGGDMPVEESGNMLILAAAIAARDGNADYARDNWGLLSTWARFLLDHGLDPENQLCTDDFAGHLAHNANLSVKAILGIASYGRLAGMLGDSDTEREWMGRAREYAAEWCRLADDGDHYRLAFDKPGSWSMKYNLVWDKLLGFDLFPDEVVEKETAWYLDHANMYGVPLDSREAYTKSDWLVWVASMAPAREAFIELIAPLDRFMGETADRMPMTDWYWTHRPEAKHYREHATDKAFRARSVVGGHFMKLLQEKMK